MGVDSMYVEYVDERGNETKYPVNVRVVSIVEGKKYGVQIPLGCDHNTFASLLESWADRVRRATDE